MASNIPDWAKESSVPEWAREKPAPTRNIAAVANDWVIEAANAIAGTVGAVSEFVSPGNRFAKGVEELVRKGEESQSDVTKQSKQRMRQGLEQAEGFGQEAGIVGQYLLESPGLAAAQALGSFAGPGLAVGGAARAAGGLAAGRATAAGATAAEAAARGAQVGSRVGLGAGAVVSGAAAGGDAAGNAYDLVMRAPDEVLSVTPEWKELAASLPPEQIKEQLATAAARDGSILPAIVGAVTGAFGAEKLIAGTPAAKIIGQATSRKGAALRTGLTEATQEGFEEGITQYEGQRAASQYDLTIDPMQGVGGAATMGAALGGVSGGVIGGVVGPQRAAPAPAPTPANPDAQLDRSLDQLQRARDEVYLGTSDGKETLASIVSAPDLGAAIDAAEANVPSMADLLQQKRTTAAERVAQELGIEPAGNFPTAEQIIGGAPIPGIDVGPTGENTRPSVFGQSAGTPGLQPGETRILTQPSVFAEPSAGTPGLQPGQTRVLTQPSVFADSDSTPGLQPGQRMDTPAPPTAARLNTAQTAVDRDTQLLAQRDGTPAPQPPAKMLQDAQRLEESARLIESNPRAPEAVLQRAQALREQAQAMRARAEEMSASAPAAQPGAMTEFERGSIDAQRQTNLERRMPARAEGEASGYADLAPMDERTARGRLKVLRDQAANEGGDALGLQVVPHPNTPGRFAIAKAELPSLDMPAAPQAEVSADQAQYQIESAELTGREQRRKRLDEARQIVVTRALKNVEERGGVASPQEAQIFQEAGLGKPYDRIDESLGPKPGLVLPKMELTGPQVTPSGIVIADGGTRQTDATRDGRLQRVQGLAPATEQAQAGARAFMQGGESSPLPDAVNVNQFGQAGGTGQQNQTVVGGDTLGAELAKQRVAAGYDAKLVEAPRPGKINNMPAASLTDQQLQAIAADQKLPAITRRGAQIERAHRAAALPTQAPASSLPTTDQPGQVRASEQREETNVAPEATQQGKPVSTLGNITTVDPATLQTQSKADSGTISKQTHRMVSLIASMFGKKVVVFSSDNEMAPDGFVRTGDSKTIHLNVKSQISHLVVFGHELLHQLKADNPQAYAALMKVIKLNEGVNLDVAGIRGDMEELTADVVGNRFRETEFWRDVFREILASGKDTKASQRSAMRLGASVVRAVDRMVKALKGMTGFDTDSMVANLGEVKAAVTKALASYAQEKRGEATELIRQEVAGRQEATVETTGEIKASDQRGRLDNLEAYRYGKTARTFVNGSSFGAGLKGSSRETYMNAEDKRLKQRVYFYFDKGTGINPEAGVGPIPHRAFLNNVYDADADPQKLVAGNQLKTESNILDAGFDGYLNRLSGTQSGQVIMFGLKPIPVEALQPGQKVRSGAKLEPLPTAPAEWTTQSSGPNRAALEQKMERMQGNPAWARYDMQVVDAGSGFFSLQTKLKDDVRASAKRVPDSPEFKRWFGESKAVDGQGRPMVVYHNTSKDFAVFEPSDLGIHLGTTIAQAEDRAKVHGSEGNNTMPLYASIKNPLRLSDSPSWMDPTWSVERTGLEDYLSPELVQEARALKEKYKANRLAEGFRHDGSANRANRQAAMEVNRKIVEELKALGYDGIVYANTHDGATLAARMRADDSYVAFSPTQIKSAIGNSGTFDPTNPDIRKSEKRILLNIGLSTQEVKGGGMLTEDVVRSAITRTGVEVEDLTVHQSDSELTAVVAVNRGLTDAEGDDLSTRLNQEAIVQRMPDGSGKLFGPMAAEWGPYNAEYFVMADGNRAVDYEPIKESGKRPKPEPKVDPALAAAASDISAAKKIATSQKWRTNRDFKIAIQNAVRAALGGLGLSKDTAEVRKYLVAQILKEARAALVTNANAIGWYDEKVTTALEVVSAVHPELKTDEKSKFAFIWALAVTSNGIKVNKNFELAERAYTSWKNSSPDVDKRVMPTKGIGEGTAASKINKGLATYNELMSAWGYNKTRNFATTLQPNRQVLATFGRKVSGEGVDTMVYGAGVLGPKIGNGFFMNLFGEFGQLTMDRWFVRTWGRLTGNLVDIDQAKIRADKDAFTGLIDLIKTDKEAKRAVEVAIGAPLSKTNPIAMAKRIVSAANSEEVREKLFQVMPANPEREALATEIRGKLKDFISVADELRKAAKTYLGSLDGQIEVPQGSKQRDMMRAVAKEALTELQKDNPDLTMADFQALLWYPEKTLYDTAGAAEDSSDGYSDDEAPDYANAAVNLAKQKGISDERIRAAIEQARSDIAARKRARSGGRGSVGVPLAPGAGAGQAAGQQVKPSEKRSELVSIFNGLQNGRGLALIRAQEKAAGHPMSAAITRIDNQFYDILERLESEGAIRINCK
jgi:hypothetical protein